MSPAATLAGPGPGPWPPPVPSPPAAGRQVALGTPRMCFNTPTQLRLSCGNSDGAALEPRPGKSPEKSEGPHPGSAADAGSELLRARNKIYERMQEPVRRFGPPLLRESLLYTLARERHRREKMERRLGKTAHARRNLFGPVDHEQLQQDFQHMLHNSVERAQQKWNFDFLRDRPAEGLLQWEELEGHEVPAFYHSCVVGDARRPLQHLNWPLGREDKSHRFAQVILTEKPKTSKKRGGKRISEGKKRRQTSLTDYYSAKKRVNTNMQAAAKKSTS